MKIGFVVAMENEYEPFLHSLGELVLSERVAGMEFCVYSDNNREVVLAKCGIGEIAAAAATALLVGKYACQYIFNFGLVGSLDGRQARSLVAVRDVVHYDSDLTAFGHPLGAPNDLPSPFIAADNALLAKLTKQGIAAVRLASGDKFIADERLKNKIKSDFSANICDMEGAAVALTAARAGVPFTMIKLVSDGAGESAAESFEANKAKGFSFALSIVLSAFEEL